MGRNSWPIGRIVGPWGRYMSAYLRGDIGEAGRFRIELYVRSGAAAVATADLTHAFGFGREFVGVRARAHALTSFPCEACRRTNAYARDPTARHAEFSKSFSTRAMRRHSASAPMQLAEHEWA